MPYKLSAYAIKIRCLCHKKHRNPLEFDKASGTCTKTLWNLTKHLHCNFTEYLHRNPPEPQHASSPIDPPEPHQVAAPQTSGTSPGTCTKTL